MTVAGLDQKDFLEILKLNGYEILSSKYWELENVERIVLGKDGHTFTLKLQKYYFFPEVVQKSTSLGLTEIPDHCKDDYDACFKSYAQIKALKKLQTERRESKRYQATKEEENNDNNTTDESI